MNAYLDASVLVALFSADEMTARAETGLRKFRPVLTVSDFAAAEFASAISRRVRMKEIAKKDGQTVFSLFDSWVSRAAMRVAIVSGDVATAETFLRRLDLNLRTPDALNIAVATRVGASLATFEDKMALAARKLGLELLKL